MIAVTEIIITHQADGGFSWNGGIRKFRYRIGIGSEPGSRVGGLSLCLSRKR